MVDKNDLWWVVLVLTDLYNEGKISLAECDSAQDDLLTEMAE